MSVYMVERELPGISMGQLADAQKAAIDTSKQFTKQGKPVERALWGGVVQRNLSEASECISRPQ